MDYYAGTQWRHGIATPEVWVATEAGRVVDEGHGRPPRAATPAVLLDGLYNLHTHIGDAFLAGEALPHDLAELVAPPAGLKHRRLAAAPPQALREGMRRQLAAHARVGVEAIVDFREQGEAGVRLAHEANTPPIVRTHLLGRPLDPESGDEMSGLLAAADGIGAPSVTDWGLPTCQRLAEAAHRRGKPFAVHASEARPEPIHDILGLEPDLLVHLGAASRADLRLVADAGVPVAVCPSSNEFFNLPCAADRLAALGVPWFLGTDNAMLGGVDPVDEARRLAARHPDLEPDELLRALTTPPAVAVPALASEPTSTKRAMRLRVIPTTSRGTIRWDAAPLVLERAT